MWLCFCSILKKANFLNFNQNFLFSFVSESWKILLFFLFLNVDVHAGVLFWSWRCIFCPSFFLNQLTLSVAKRFWFFSVKFCKFLSLTPNLIIILKLFLTTLTFQILISWLKVFSCMSFGNVFVPWLLLNDCKQALVFFFKHQVTFFWVYVTFSTFSLNSINLKNVKKSCHNFSKNIKQQNFIWTCQKFIWTCQNFRQNFKDFSKTFQKLLKRFYNF